MKHLLLLIGLTLTLTASAKDYGVFVNGGYQRGNSKMNNLVKDRVDRAKAAFDKRADKESHAANDRDELYTALQGINCGPGDTLTIFLMGHGTKDKFIFSLETDINKRILEAKKLQERITAAISDCTCIVRVIIFSCHSGSFLNDLFKDPHVEAVYASCRSDEKSYTDAVFKPGGFEDNGDWAKEFVKKWDTQDPATDLGITLAEANRCANEMAPPEFAKDQKPTGWVRGTFEVKAHIDKNKMTSKSKNVSVTFYNPAHLRGSKDMIDIRDIKPTAGETFKQCQWITFQAKFGTPNGSKPKAQKNPVLASAPVACEAPTESFLAHVNKNRSKGSISVTLLQPNWLGCMKRTIKGTGGVARDVQRCSFIQGNGKISSAKGHIIVDEPVNRFNYCPEVILKLSSVQTTRNKICGWIMRPLSLKFLTARKEICIIVPNKEKNLFEGLKKGQFVRCKLKTNATSVQHYRGSNFRRVASSEADLITFDPALGGMENPVGTIPGLEPFPPIIEIANYGEMPHPTGAVLDVRIRDSFDNIFYEESVPVPAIETKLTTMVTCPDWFPEVPGSYRLEAELNISGGTTDDELRNNAFIYPFEVAEFIPGSSGESWTGDYIDLPLFMEFSSEERLLQVPGAGTGVGTTSDQLGFVHQPIEGDFFVSGFFDLTDLNPSHSLGFMARSSTAALSAMVSWAVDGMLDLKFASRISDGVHSSPQHQSPVTGDGIWLGLEREGELFHVFSSPDGSEWDLLGSQTISGLPSELLVGVASTSGADESQPQSAGLIQGVRGFPAGLTDLATLEDLAVMPLSATELQLSWSDVGSSEVGYLVRRSDDGLEFSDLAFLPSDTSDFIDGTLTSGDQPLYQVVPMTLYGRDDSPVVDTAETPGQGLEFWALSNDIGDPYQSPPWGGEPWLFHYFTGASPFVRLTASDLMQPQVINGVPYIVINKAPGVADHQLHVELWDEINEVWEQRFTIFSNDLAGPYQFEMSSNGLGKGLHRIMIEPSE